jgi:branched-chain amino acid transport system substrate-binding protein
MAVATGLIGALPAFASADVKVGLTAPLTGQLAAVGQDQVDGFMLGLEMLNGKLGGQPVSVKKEDDQLKPEIGKQLIRKLLSQEKVDALVGLGTSNVMMAMMADIVESGIPAIATTAGPSPIAGAQCAANVFSVAWANDSLSEVTGRYAQDKGYKRVHMLAPNYQAGKDMVAGFKRQYKGEIIGEAYTPLNQLDYSAEITELQASRADGVFVFYPGGLGVNFFKQFSQSGLTGKLPVFGPVNIDATNLTAIQGAALGAVTGTVWSGDLTSPANLKFVAAFKAKYKRNPSEYAATAYDAANLLDLAIRKLGGDTSNKAAFVAAVKAAGKEFTSVRGPFRFNNNNMPIQNYYAVQVVRDGKQFVLKKVATPLSDHQDPYHDQCTARQ